jgi:hypothetical protein
MGTNYYWIAAPKPPCSHCGRAYDVERKHIGKSSAGWVFALHIYPEEGINELPDWRDKWQEAGRIEDEYGNAASEYEMLDTIAFRFAARTRPDNDDSWYAMNQAQRGPYGLATARLGSRCRGLGLGTYALHLGQEDSW